VSLLLCSHVCAYGVASVLGFLASSCLMQGYASPLVSIFLHHRFDAIVVGFFSFGCLMFRIFAASFVFSRFSVSLVVRLVRPRRE